MKFYMTPGSCSTGIHILLEEIGLVFEAYIVNLVKGDHLKPEYLAINPMGTIPTLVRDDGVALTDFVAIATWLAGAYPRRQLSPRDPQLAKAAQATLRFCTRHIHGEGFRRVFTPERYATTENPVNSVKAQGRRDRRRGFRDRQQRTGRQGLCRRRVLDRRRGVVLRRVLGRQDQNGAAAPLPRALSTHAAASRRASGAGRGGLPVRPAAPGPADGSVFVCVPSLCSVCPTPAKCSAG